MTMMTTTLNCAEHMAHTFWMQNTFTANVCVRKMPGSLSFLECRVDAIKQTKLKLFRHVCRMKDKRLVNTVVMGMVEGDQSLN